MNLTEKYAVEVARENKAKYDKQAAWDAVSYEFGGSVEVFVDPEAICNMKQQRDELLEAAKNSGGGDLYIEDYGRTCHCPYANRKGGVSRKGMAERGNHATSCNDMWDAIANAAGSEAA
ncbi:MAG: hypothetical protein K8U57_21455 [Planctomycetes bacterium]|nr:hypothetical protein [Planctomycetota bacterium]